MFGLGIALGLGSQSLFGSSEPVQRTLYHREVSYDLEELSDWFMDQEFTIPATSLPTSIDLCYLNAFGYPYGTLVGGLTCLILGVYGGTSFSIDPEECTIYTPEVYVYAELYGTVAVVTGGTFPVTTYVSCAVDYATVSITAPNAGVFLGGSGATCYTICYVCQMDGSGSTFLGTADFVYANGIDCAVGGETALDVALNGSGCYTTTGQSGTTLATGSNTRTGYGSTSGQISLSGDYSYMEYGSACSGDVVMLGTGSYLSSGSIVSGDVYYDPLVAINPTGSGAEIAGNIYNYIP